MWCVSGWLLRRWRPWFGEDGMFFLRRNEVTTTSIPCPTFMQYNQLTTDIAISDNFITFVVITTTRDYTLQYSAHVLLQYTQIPITRCDQDNRYKDATNSTVFSPTVTDEWTRVRHKTDHCIDTQTCDEHYLFRTLHKTVQLRTQLRWLWRRRW